MGSRHSLLFVVLAAVSFVARKGDDDARWSMINDAVTLKASVHSTSKTLPGGEFDWGGTSPKQ